MSGCEVQGSWVQALISGLELQESGSPGMSSGLESLVSLGVLAASPFRSFPKLGVAFRGPNTENHRILGSILGYSYSWKQEFPKSCSWIHLCESAQQLCATDSGSSHQRGST